jgi:DNA helicase-2/ATP-dependent DNA helicase PcrA
MILLTNEMITEEKNRYDILEIFDRIIESNNTIDLEKMLNIMFVTLSDKEQDLEENTVPIMTMHQAKGLTADAVFVVAAEEEYIPGIASGQEEIEDSRRLLYVSLTRAKHYLFITHCQNRTGIQKHSGSRPGITRRRLSTFLRNGPIPSIPAEQFIDNL